MGHTFSSHSLATGLVHHGKVAAKLCLPEQDRSVDLHAGHRTGLFNLLSHSSMAIMENSQYKSGECASLRVVIKPMSPQFMQFILAVWQESYFLHSVDTSSINLWISLIFPIPGYKFQ